MEAHIRITAEGTVGNEETDEETAEKSCIASINAPLSPYVEHVQNSCFSEYKFQ